MPHQDSRTNSSYLAEALQWLFKGIRFQRKLRTDCSWTFVWLVKAALLWAWSNERKLTQRFACAQRLTIHLQQEPARKTTTSWQAFAEILRRHTAYLREVLTTAFRHRMMSELGDLVRVAGFVVLGVDGSDIAVPLTQSNEQAFSTRKPPGRRDRRKAKNHPGANKRSASPQILLTTLFVVGIHLPWNWRIGGRGESERGHLRLMLDDLPESCLLAADAGFVGYDLAAAIVDSGAELVIRVGANIRLLKKLGCYRESGARVYLWPEKAARKNRKPLVFRLIVLAGRRHPIYLITSVLDKERLSDRQVSEIYRARWSIEIYHRHLKQTFGRRKLLSRSRGNARIELEWSLLALWAMGLYASVQLNQHAIPLERMSFAGVLDAFREVARDYLHPADRLRTLRIRLRQALIDIYQRTSKRNRDYPRRKKHKHPAKPELKTATPKQRKHAKRLLDTNP